MITSKLPPPLDKIEIEVEKGGHKDFGLAPDDPYPLKGVTYPVDYGYLPGYIAEDDAELDFFVGSNPDGEAGYILVSRGEGKPNEHKYYIGLSAAEVEAVLEQFQPVLVEHKSIAGIEQLLGQIEVFKHE